MTARAANPFGMVMVMFLLFFEAVVDSTTASILIYQGNGRLGLYAE
jgi:hypothetical protein